MIENQAPVLDVHTKPIPVDPAIAQRFWSKVQMAPGDGCWEWQGKRDRDGYGEFSIGKDTYVASRVAYTIENGPIPPGNLICHHCDNPPCVRPSHLRADYPLGNTLDKIKRGRHWHGIKVLTIEQRDQLWALHTDGVSVSDISHRLGCSRKTVRYHIQLRDTNQRLRAPRADCRAQETRRCTKCEATLDTSQFYRNKHGDTWYYRAWCKRCTIDYVDQRRRAKRNTP